MKKVLITGANSYIGMAVENWLNNIDDDLYVETVDMIDGKWREKDFSSILEEEVITCEMGADSIVEKVYADLLGED